MDLNHLHLHVRDLDRSRAFYATYFGFQERVRYGTILFLRNGEGFDLALAPAAAVEPFPEWFHFGFRLASADAVRALYARMEREAVPRRKALVEEVAHVSFRCA